MNVIPAPVVIPAKAGIAGVPTADKKPWIPAFAGMTRPDTRRL
jgi:hypothetical protein